MNSISISEHAYSRAKERLGLNKKSLERLVEYAYWFGKDTIDNLNGIEYNLCRAKQYGDYIYIFNRNRTLITMYMVKKKYKKKIHSSKHIKHTWRKRK